MKYDFTTIWDRKGKDALALDIDRSIAEGMIGVADRRVREGFSVIPMWVADMNFATVPTVAEAITERLQHPLFGYYLPKKEYYDAILRWQEDRNGVQGLTRACIGYENGVLGGVISALNAVCSRGDHVLVHSPTYVGFTHCLTDNGYDLVHSPLKKDENGVWRMDLGDMEEKLRKYKIHAALFCSPHNPCGCVWEREELERMMELFKKYNVTVVSDEIWSDLTLSGYKHIPTQSVSDDAKKRTIALYAPTKTFNLAGLIGSYHIIYDPLLRDRVRKESQNTHYNSMNVLSMHALIGAYGEEGRVWVDELRQVLTENADFACDFIEKHFDSVTASRPQGTYMLFLDCGEWCRKHGKTMDELERAGISIGVIWQDGRRFHGENSIRMNLALPHSLVKEAFERRDRYVFNA